MELMECVKGRRSIRSFKGDGIKDEDILVALEAATFAPSPYNCQPWNFIVIRDVQMKKRMAEVIEIKLKTALNMIGGDDDANHIINYAKFFSFFEQAPVVVAVICRTVTSPLAGFLQRAGVPPEELEDTSHSDIQGTAAAVQNMLLKFYEMGLGASWMTNPLIATRELESLLEIKKPWHLMAMIPVGLPASMPPTPRRKAVSFVTKFI